MIVDPCKTIRAKRHSDATFTHRRPLHRLTQRVKIVVPKPPTPKR
nr:MAG TPA: hypothetical protein [Caudoviricetes sp.]